MLWPKMGNPKHNQTLLSVCACANNKKIDRSIDRYFIVIAHKIQRDAVQSQPLNLAASKQHVVNKNVALFFKIIYSII